MKISSAIESHSNRMRGHKTKSGARATNSSKNCFCPDSHNIFSQWIASADRVILLINVYHILYLVTNVPAKHRKYLTNSTYIINLVFISSIYSAASYRYLTRPIVSVALLDNLIVWNKNKQSTISLAIHREVALKDHHRWFFFFMDYQLVLLRPFCYWDVLWHSKMQSFMTIQTKLT